MFIKFFVYYGLTRTNNLPHIVALENSLSFCSIGELSLVFVAKAHSLHDGHGAPLISRQMLIIFIATEFGSTLLAPFLRKLQQNPKNTSRVGGEKSADLELCAVDDGGAERTGTSRGYKTV